MQPRVQALELGASPAPLFLRLFLHMHNSAGRRGAHAECYALTAAALERDPYAAACLPAHLASALELRKKNELFLRGHK